MLVQIINIQVSAFVILGEFKVICFFNNTIIETIKRIAMIICHVDKYDFINSLVSLMLVEKINETIPLSNCLSVNDIE